MKNLFLLACWSGLGAITLTGETSAHNMPWRDGESRQVGYGHCAKEPCTKRTCWAPTRPHRHQNGQIVVSRFGGPECWGGSAHQAERRHR